MHGDKRKAEEHEHVHACVGVKEREREEGLHFSGEFHLFVGT